MERIRVIIEKAPHNYSAYMPEIGNIVTTGKTIEKIITNMYEAIDFYIEVAKEDGSEIPDQLKGDFTLVFELAEAPVKTVRHGKTVMRLATV